MENNIILVHVSHGCGGNMDGLYVTWPLVKVSGFFDTFKNVCDNKNTELKSTTIEGH